MTTLKCSFFFSLDAMCVNTLGPLKTLSSSGTTAQRHLGRFWWLAGASLLVGLKLPLFRVKLWMSKAISFTDKCHYIQSNKALFMWLHVHQNKVKSPDALKSKFMRYFCIWSQCVKSQNDAAASCTSTRVDTFISTRTGLLLLPRVRRTSTPRTNSI